MKPSVVVLLGAPGAGKGTQAARLSDEYGLPHVSTGELFRANIAQGTTLGESARSYVEGGQLVPDEVVVDMLFDRVAQEDCEGGYLLDGFPRTLAQARSFAERTPAAWMEIVLNLEINDERIVERISGRLACSECANVHHPQGAPPSVAGRCDRCGGVLYQRDDDAPQLVRERLAVYHRQTEPLVGYYATRGSLCEVDGQGSPDEVFGACKSCIESMSSGLEGSQGVV